MSKVRTLADVIAYNKRNEAKAMPYFKQERLEESNSKGDLNSKEYIDSLEKSTSTRQIINELMRKKRLDAIAGTSIGLASCTDLINGDYFTGFYFCPPSAMAGYPHITVPMGTVHELPVGLSFMAGAYQEAEVIKLAYAFEQATKKRTAPKFIKSSIV